MSKQTMRGRETNILKPFLLRVCLFQPDEYGMRVGLFTLIFTHTQLV